MRNVLIPILEVVDVVLALYYWAVIIAVVMSWLINFNVVNRSNQIVRMVMSTLDQLVEPVLMRIRRVMPMMGALDLSPLVLILIIYLIRRYLFLLILG